MRHSHLAVIQQHAVHFLDGAVGGVLGLKVDKGVALGAIFVTHHLEQRRTEGWIYTKRHPKHKLRNSLSTISHLADHWITKAVAVFMLRNAKQLCFIFSQTWENYFHTHLTSCKTMHYTRRPTLQYDDFVIRVERYFKSVSEFGLNTCKYLNIKLIKQF